LALAKDSNGNLFYCGRRQLRIRRISPYGTTNTMARQWGLVTPAMLDLLARRSGAAGLKNR